MSVKVQGLVWDHYPVGGNELLVAVKLADHADHDGNNIWPSVKFLAEKTHQSRRSVQYQLRKMEERGWLVVVEKGLGAGNTSRYRIPIELIPQGVVGKVQTLRLFPSSPEQGSPTPSDAAPERRNLQQEKAQSTAGKGATAIAPEPSVTVKKQPSSTPSSFELTDEIKTWAEARGYTPFLQAHLEHFKDYLANRTGKPYRDLECAFRNCVRSDWGGVRAAMIREKRVPAKAADTSCRVMLPTNEVCGLPGRPHPVYGFACDHCLRKQTEARRGETALPDLARDFLKSRGMLRRPAEEKV